MTESRWLSGNEAVARGLLDAGARVVAGYPGGPSGEVVEEVARLALAGAAGEAPRVEWSMNERVALDVAAGAAMAGVRAAAVMKHFGLNVAADVLHSVNVMGVPRLVLIVGDDPQGHSSHNEQDSRRYAAFAQVPCLEPATPEDAYRAVGLAFHLSETLAIPVVVRLVTSVSYAEGPARLPGPGETSLPPAGPLWTEHGFHGRPVVGNHVRLYRKTADAVRALAALGVARRYGPATGALGVVACGVGRPIALAALADEGYLDAVPVLEPVTSFPLPEEACLAFLRSVGSVLVVEETDPVVEDALRELAHRHGVATPVRGKRDGAMPVAGELDGAAVAAALRTLLAPDGAPAPQRPRPPEALAGALVDRRSVTAPGHAHRLFFFALRQAMAKAEAEGRRVVVMGDVGEAQKNAGPVMFLHGAMGSGIGSAHGAALADPAAILVGLSGDATLYSFALQGVMNVLYNHGSAVLLVADNRSMESSGVDVTPTSGANLTGAAPAWDPAPTLAALGARVWEVSSTDLAAAADALEAALFGTPSGLRVVVARGEALPARLAQLRGAEPLAVDARRCSGCRLCVDRFGCPAILWTGERAAIAPALCVGCGDCRPVCPDDAFVTAGVRA
ncbi:MAG TPA: thiamine pyrophosphate-dependent enzyme [Thermodesulfobacteriota bacterium]